MSSEENICSICLNVLKRPSFILPCNHEFCKECLEGWVSTNDLVSEKNCPQCRQKLPPTKEMLSTVRSFQLAIVYFSLMLESKEELPLPMLEGEPGFGEISKIYRFFQDEDDILELHHLPSEEQQLQLVIRIQLFLNEAQGLVRAFEEQYGENIEVLLTGDEDDVLPREIYQEVESGDFECALAWLGPEPIAKERIEAEYIEGGGIRLLHIAVQSLRQGKELFMHYLLQNGARIGSTSIAQFKSLCQCFLRATSAQDGMSSSATRTIKVLLEWGESKPILLLSLDMWSYRDSENLKSLKKLMQSPLGGRRCEIQDLQKRSDLNGKTAIAVEHKHFRGKDRYVLCVEGSNERLSVQARHLKRRDRTPSDCTFKVYFNSASSEFEKEWLCEL